MFIHNDTLAGLAFFTGLPDEEAKALAPHARIRACEKKQPLFWSGDPATALLFLVTGRVKIYLQGEANHQTVLRVANRGDVIGLIPLLEEPAVHLVCAEAMTRATLLEIDMGAAKRALHSSPGFLEKILKAVAVRARANLETRHVMSLPAAKRVGWLLLRLSSGMVGKGGTFRFPYDKGAAAAELCMSPETFSRSLTQLKCAGVSCAEGQITIEGFEALRDFVRRGEAGCLSSFGTKDLPECDMAPFPSRAALGKQP